MTMMSADVSVGLRGLASLCAAVSGDGVVGVRHPDDLPPAYHPLDHAEISIQGTDAEVEQLSAAIEGAAEAEGIAVEYPIALHAHYGQRECHDDAAGVTWFRLCLRHLQDDQRV